MAINVTDDSVENTTESQVEPQVEPQVESTLEENNSEESIYVGSKLVNPYQHPFTPSFEKEVEKYGYSKEKIDELITVDPSVIMTSEQIEELDKKVEKDENKDENKTDDLVSLEENNDGEKNIDEVEKFYNDTKLTKEEFESLNEDAQKIIADKFENKSYDVDEFNTLKQNFEEYKKSVETLTNDPYVKNRIKEIQENTNYLPKQINSLSNEEYENIQSAESAQECNDIINKIVNDRVRPHVENVWSLIENENNQKKQRNDCEKLLLSIGELDKEFKVNVKSFDDIQKDEKILEQYNKGLGKIVNYLQEKGENWITINKKSPKEILAAYNIYSGRDQEVLKNIEKQTKKKLFDKLKNPTIAKDAQSRKAKTIKNSGSSKWYPGGTENHNGFDRNTLIEQMVKGNFAEYNRLGDFAAANADKKQIDYLNGVYADYLALRKQK